MSRTAPVQTPMMSLLAAMVMPFATHATTAAPLAPGLDRDNAELAYLTLALTRRRGLRAG